MGKAVVTLIKFRYHIRDKTLLTPSLDSDVSVTDNIWGPKVRMMINGCVKEI
jgi:hypothetical protein